MKEVEQETKDVTLIEAETLTEVEISIDMDETLTAMAENMVHGMANIRT